MYSSNGVGIWNSTQLHYTGGIPQFCGVNAVELELHNVFYKHVRTFVNVLATYTVELELHWSSTMFFISAYIRMYYAYINVLRKVRCGATGAPRINLGAKCSPGIDTVLSYSRVSVLLASCLSVPRAGIGRVMPLPDLSLYIPVVCETDSKYTGKCYMEKFRQCGR